MCSHYLTFKVDRDLAVYPGLDHVFKGPVETYTSAGTLLYIWNIITKSTQVYDSEMAKLQVVSSLADETDQPPGTFKLVRG
jgi:hypothetical protein